MAASFYHFFQMFGTIFSRGFTHNMYCGKDLGQQDDKCVLNGTKLECVRVHVHCFVCVMVGLYFNSFYTSVKLYG